MNANLFIYPFIVSAIIAVFATSIVKKLAWKYGLIDDPAVNKHPKVIHTKPTPRAGGLAIYIAFVAAALIFVPHDQYLWGIIVGATLLVIMGVIDDKISLSPYLRLGIQLLAAICPVAVGIGITFFTNPFGDIVHLSNLWPISEVFTILWIVVIMNFVNMGAKGVDGQLTGVVIIAAITIAALSNTYSADITEWPVIILAAITAGSFFGFLPWHLYPQKIMPGFSGSTLGGYLLAVLAILTTAKVGTLALVLGIPIIDTTYTIIRRIASGKSPVWGDRGHLHHKLLDIGWSKQTVTYFYWGATALLGFLSLYLNAQNKLYTITGVALCIGGTLVWITHYRD